MKSVREVQQQISSPKNFGAAHRDVEQPTECVKKHDRLCVDSPLQDFTKSLKSQQHLIARCALFLHHPLKVGLLVTHQSQDAFARIYEEKRTAYALANRSIEDRMLFCYSDRR
jgi:hypothetical protein